MIDLYNLEFQALEALIAAWSDARGDAHAHAQQVWEWLYHRRATDYGGMATLPPAVRKRLEAETRSCAPLVLARQEAPDGETRKDLLQLADGEQVEVVLLRYRERRSACVSTQAGCACGCAFCATGQMGFVRDLSAGEIIAQVLHLQRELAARQEQPSNVVLMGMGEPLLNYEHTLAAIRRMIDQRALGFPQRRITLSTVGIVPALVRLVQEDLAIKLAISLHAATDALRDRLVPINQRYPLDDLFAALRAYAAETKRRVMLEWVLIDGVNDTSEQAEALVERAGSIPVHVNLIRLNPTQGYMGRPPSPTAVEGFIALLDRAGIPHTMRQRRGAAISAGCGQLRSRRRSAVGDWCEDRRLKGYADG